MLGAGGEPFDLGPAGLLYSKNITPAGIGSWTDGELLRATTQGVSKDGTPLFPLMPYPHFGAMSEDDIHAVLAYVRSWKAIEGVAPDRKLTFSAQLDRAHDPGPNTFQTRPSPTDKVAYGKYMTRQALCSDCHTPIDDRGTPLPGMDFAGGMEFVETGYRVRSANITPDADTGIGAWTEQQFIDKFKGFENAEQRDAQRDGAPPEYGDAADRVCWHDARRPLGDLWLPANPEAGHQSRQSISGCKVRRCSNI